MDLSKRFRKISVSISSRDELMKKILTVIGTRPQFIKYAAVSKEIRRIFRETLVDTGQHYSNNLSADFIKEFCLPRPDFTIGASETNVLSQISTIILSVDKIINNVKPDFLICFGDTNSALAASLASLKHCIPVVHIEAGERNFDIRGKRVPAFSIPEEANRIAVDSISSVLMCASKRAVRNLKEESVTGKIFFTGDIMYDLYRTNVKNFIRDTSVLNKYNLKRGSYIYCTIHRVINTDNKKRLLSFLNVFKNIKQEIIFPMHPRTRKMLKLFGLYGKFASLKNCNLIEPVGYADSIALNYFSAAIMTDSGGVIREAFFNGRPSVMLDETSEWLDLYRGGWSVLAGANEKKILEGINRKNIPLNKPWLFGNGNAAIKTVNYLKQC